ncbi:MAG: phosphatase PAP2 family protein [Candidatus Hodarchaeales archaeon]|jgi:membrane-associated phospholipid phosphatase
MYFFQEIIKNPREKRPILFLLFGIWILLALVFIFFDLPISIVLVDYNSHWAKFVTLYGEIPGHIVISISIFVLFANGGRNTKWSDNLVRTIVLIINSVFIVNILHALFPHIAVEAGEVMVMTGMVMICQFVVVILLRKAELNPGRKYIDFAKISLILAIINPLIFVQTIKILWGRTRFRDLTGDYHEFTPWFIPQGVTGHKSFPSGHTAMGWMVLPILFLLPRIGKRRWIVQGMIFLWGLFVAIGRIVIGAHYASDVFFSTGIAFTAYIYLISERKQDNSQKN